MDGKVASRAANVGCVISRTKMEWRVVITKTRWQM
jgi:hypothetical protein